MSRYSLPPSSEKTTATEVESNVPTVVASTESAMSKLSPSTVAVSPVISEKSVISNASSKLSTYEEPDLPMWDSNIVFAAAQRSSSCPPTLPANSGSTVASTGPQRTVYLDDKSSTPHVRKPFACSRQGCDRSFKSRNHLARHERMHSGEKPFKCQHPYCHKRFSRRDNMEQHMNTHRPNDYVDPMVSQQVQQRDLYQEQQLSSQQGQQNHSQREQQGFSQQELSSLTMQRQQGHLQQGHQVQRKQGNPGQQYKPS
jgi:hypothetical protein